jgi:hypothetical protein
MIRTTLRKFEDKGSRGMKDQKIQAFEGSSDDYCETKPDAEP